MEKILSSSNLAIFEKAIGKNSIKYFNKSKVFFSSLIYSKNFDNLIFQRGNLILKEFSNPFIEDWKVYITLRAHCKTWITTAKMLRDEKDLNTYHTFDFLGQEDLKHYFYKKEGKNNINNNDFSYDSESCRNVFIMSKTLKLEEIMSLRFFKEKEIKKYAMLNNDLNEKLKNNVNLNDLENFFNKNNITLVDQKLKDIKEAVSFCQNNLRIKDSILLEAGTSIMTNFFIEENDIKNNQRENPIDFLLLSVYEGEINKESIGDCFTSFEELKTSGLLLVNISEKIKSEQGFLTFYTFVHRNIL